MIASFMVLVVGSVGVFVCMGFLYLAIKLLQMAVERFNFNKEG